MNHPESHQSSLSPFPDNWDEMTDEEQNAYWIRKGDEVIEERRRQRPNERQREDQAIGGAERAIKQAMEWLERAKLAADERDADNYSRGDPIEYTTRAENAARLARPIEVPRDAPPELVQLAEVLSRRARQFDIIEDMPGAREENLRLRLLLATIAEFIDDAEDLRRSLVVQFVNQKQISRKHAAEILGVHQQTVANWVNEDTPAHGITAENAID